MPRRSTAQIGSPGLTASSSAACSRGTRTCISGRTREPRGAYSGELVPAGSTGRREDRDDLGLQPAGDVDLVVRVDEHVHLAADPEPGEVDPRLDREARPGQDEALVVG